MQIFNFSNRNKVTDGQYLAPKHRLDVCLLVDNGSTLVKADEVYIKKGA